MNYEPEAQPLSKLSAKSNNAGRDSGRINRGTRQLVISNQQEIAEYARPGIRILWRAPTSPMCYRDGGLYTTARDTTLQ
jgi:hypothetical protein